MRLIRRNRSVIWFIGVLLLAGIANQFSRTGNLLIDALMCSMNDLIYIALLLFWLQSVRVRLLPSKVRSGIVSSACLMLFYLFIRVFKYVIVESTPAVRYAAYTYWAPQMLIPTLFLMTCIRIRRGEREKKTWNERLLLIPAAALSVLVMTNDLHRLVYQPGMDLSQFRLNTGTYTLGPGFYVLLAWMLLTTSSGLLLLLRETGRRPGKIILPLLGVVVIWNGLVLLNILILDRSEGFRMFNVPETHIFCMLGVIEISIRTHLIPNNENYAVFFRKLHIPALITDRQFKPFYHTDSAVSVGRDTLRGALNEPVALSPDLTLHGKEIKAGYAFWAEDESAVHRVQEKLISANEMIEMENDLIRAETEQKEKDGYLQSRHHIYHEIAEKLYPCQKRIGQILGGAAPGAQDFRSRIAQVSVLNAYVKRKTNLLLLAAENECISTDELYFALNESAVYLSLAGLYTTTYKPEEKLYPAQELIGLYDAFETIAEQMMGKTSSMMVSWTEDGLCLAVEADWAPETIDCPLPMRLRSVEGTLYMDLRIRAGGVCA
ncbi:MAG: hypothetical protein IKQ41_13690 [Clostridia bacterium]|nr:hypothetical protein [Clostridia bacterium]